MSIRRTDGIAGLADLPTDSKVLFYTPLVVGLPEHSVTEVLELLEEEEGSTELPPTSEPGSSGPN